MHVARATKQVAWLPLKVHPGGVSTLAWGAPSCTGHMATENGALWLGHMVEATEHLIVNGTLWELWFLSTRCRMED